MAGVVKMMDKADIREKGYRQWFFRPPPAAGKFQGMFVESLRDGKEMNGQGCPFYIEEKTGTACHAPTKDGRTGSGTPLQDRVG